jgi:Polymer-forming cytoskeletal
MDPRLPLILRLCLVSLLIAFVSGAAFADKSRERTQFGHDITVSPDEETSEVTCFGCSVRIRGHVTGDVTTFGGSVTVEDDAEVAGDLTAFGGSVRLNGPVKVNGDLAVFGGRIHRDSASTVGGDVTNLGGGFWIVLIFGLPLIFLGAFIALVVWLVRLLVRPRVPAAA